MVCCLAGQRVAGVLSLRIQQLDVMCAPPPLFPSATNSYCLVHFPCVSLPEIAKNLTVYDTRRRFLWSLQLRHQDEGQCIRPDCCQCTVPGTPFHLSSATYSHAHCNTLSIHLTSMSSDLCLINGHLAICEHRMSCHCYRRNMSENDCMTRILSLILGTRNAQLTRSPHCCPGDQGGCLRRILQGEPQLHTMILASCEFFVL